MKPKKYANVLRNDARAVCSLRFYGTNSDYIGSSMSSFQQIMSCCSEEQLKPVALTPYRFLKLECEI